MVVYQGREEVNRGNRIMRIYRRYADLEDTQVHYRETGAGECLLLIHEMPLSSEVFEPLMQRLGDKLHLVAPDLPGYGDSDPLHRRFTMPQYATLLLRLMEQRGIAAFSVLGVHGGASVAVEMAHQAPSRVRSLILSGVPLFTEEERVKLHQNLKPFHYDDSGRHYQEWWDFFANKWDPATPKAIIHKAVMNVMKAGPHYDWGYREAFDYDPEPALKQLTQPMLLLIAKEDPLVAKNALIRKMHPHAREVVVNVPQHLSQAAPEETARHITDFISTL